jgi:Protein of unknown function (DUF4233)
MRVLGSTMMSLQAVVLLLALPVATSVSGLDAGQAWLYFAGAALLCITTAAMVTRPFGIWCGWLAQLATILLGFIVPWLFFLGAVFAALWWAAIVFSARVAALKAAHEAASATE